MMTAPRCQKCGLVFFDEENHEPIRFPPQLCTECRPQPKQKKRKKNRDYHDDETEVYV